MSHTFHRRNFLKTASVGIGASALALHAKGTNAQVFGTSEAPKADNQVPSGMLAPNFEIGRMLLGGNLLTHYTHARDLAYTYNLARHYNTLEKIFETMRISEAHGINSVMIHTATGVIDMMKEYKKQGGKMKWIVCPTAPVKDDMGEYTRMCEQLVDADVDSIYLWGVQADVLAGLDLGGNTSTPRPDLIQKVVRLVRSYSLPVGVAAHRLNTIELCETSGTKPDFYIKTFHHHNYPSAILNYDSMWCHDPEKSVEVMAKIDIPWIAFKVMAAGAIPPRSAFEYAFVNGADFCLSGMFDFEIAEDTRIVNEVLALDHVKNRARKWHG